MTCDRPHRWGGFKRVGPGATFIRGCRRRACTATETVKANDQQLSAIPAPGDRIAIGRNILTRTRHGLPYLRAG